MGSRTDFAALPLRATGAFLLALALATGAHAQEGPAPSVPAEAPAPVAPPAAAPAPIQAEATEAPPPAAPESPAPAERLLPASLSPWGMFLAADVVVKAVMIGLAFASLVTWTVWLAKSLELVVARTRLRRRLAAVLGAGQLADLDAAFAGESGPVALMARAARQEVAASAPAIDAGAAAGLLDRIGSTLSRIEARVGRRLAIGTGVLATIGATAPFVGLFGTVWGIMNSFIGISETQTTNLAVVAPGIAEALLATSLGLVAAIPAVMIYNHFARSIAGYRALLADAAAAVERLVSRDLDLGRVTAEPSLRRAAE